MSYFIMDIQSWKIVWVEDKGKTIKLRESFEKYQT